MAVTAVVATGTTFTLSGFTYKILNIDVGPITREVIDASKMDTSTWHEFTPANLRDGGEVTLELESDGTIPTFGNAATGTIAFPNAASRAASMFLTSISINAPLEGKITMNATFKVTGAWS
jgi:hypothetical protein